MKKKLVINFGYQPDQLFILLNVIAEHYFEYNEEERKRTINVAFNGANPRTRERIESMLYELNTELDGVTRWNPWSTNNGA